MASLSFYIDDVVGANAQAKITLQEDIANQVRVTIEVITGVAIGDITGVFFDVADNNVSGLSVPLDGKTVTDRIFQVNHVLNVGGLASVAIIQNLLMLELPLEQPVPTTFLRRLNLRFQEPV